MNIIKIDSINGVDLNGESKNISEVQLLDSVMIQTLNELSSKAKIFMKFKKHPTVNTGAILIFGEKTFEGLGKNIKESRYKATKKALQEYGKLEIISDVKMKQFYKSPISELNEIAQRSNKKLDFMFTVCNPNHQYRMFNCVLKFGEYTSNVTCSNKQKCKEECSRIILEEIQKIINDTIPQPLKSQCLNLIETNEKHLPRDYQEEIYNKGVNSNIIACLATGTGKTFIAVMLIKKFSEQTFLQIPHIKRIIFLVPTVALVFQQSDYIIRHTNLKVGSFCGDNSFSMEDYKRWRDEFINNNILIMTAEILKQLLQFAIFDISEICLLIFDECHHGINSGHPYNIIMTLYYSKKRHTPQNVPRIIGLSASPALNINVESFGHLQIKERIEELEKIFDSQCITSLEHIESLKAVTSNPQINMVVYCESEPSFLVQNISKLLIDNKEKMSKFCTQIFSIMGIDSNLEYIFNLKIETKYGAVTLTSKKIEKSIIKCFNNCKKVLNDYGIFALNIILKNMFEICCNLCTHNTYQKYIAIYQKFSSYLSEMKEFTQCKINHILENTQDKSIKGLCNINLITHKVQTLLMLLCEHYSLNNNPTEEKESISTLIFTAERSTSAMMSDLVNEFAEIEGKFYNVSPRFRSTYVVGVSTLHYYQKLSVGVKEMNLKINNARLEAFHNSQFNIMFSTNVLEEGIDVRSCNVVIRLDKFSTLHSFIQSKGRIRQKQAIFYIFASEKNSYSVKTKIQNMKTAEESMESILTKYCVEEPEYSGELNYFEDLPPEEYTFITPLTQIDLRGATSFIYNYCNRLSSKCSYIVKPRFYFEKQDLKNRCVLKLPSECGISENIYSSFLNDKKLAKKHCSLRAIKLLYDKGFIDHNLTHIKCGTRIPIKLPETIPDEKDVPVNFYKKTIPESLKYIPNSSIFSCYKIEFSEFATCKSRESLYANFNFTNSDTKIGLITSGDISPVSFPLASRIFSLKINIDPFNNGKIQLDQTKLCLIKEFNKVLFNEILHTMPKSCSWSPESGHYFVLIVIFNKNDKIDYDLMRDIASYSLLTLENIINVKTVDCMDKSQLDGLFVMKNYSQDRYLYYVTNHDQVNVNSNILNIETTYKDYFSKKWSKILKENETMLTCSCITLNSLNLLNNVVSFPTKVKQYIYLPSSCVIPIPFSLSLIFKLRALPSILKRFLDFIIIEDWCKDKIQIDQIDKIDSSSLDSFVHQKSLTVTINERNKNEKNTIQFYKSLNQYWNDSLVTSKKILFKSVFQALTRVTSNECCNYERMETLGDGLLKFLLTLIIFVSNPNSDEGLLTIMRSRLTSNRYFTKIGKKIGVEKVMNSKATIFGINWCPPCTIVEKENFDVMINEVILYQYLPDKSIADVVESLVGCCLISSDISKVYEFLLKLDILKNKNIYQNFNTMQKVRQEFKNIPFEYTNIESLTNDIKAVEDIIKYKFINKNIIAQAITHMSSIVDSRQQSYERLELLGDSIIGFLVTLYLYLSHEEFKTKRLSPFVMSHLKDAVVNNKFLSIISSKTGLYKSMQLRSYELHSAITTCLNCIENIQELESFEEVPFLGVIYKPRVDIFDDHRSVTVEVVSIPKPLGDIFESIMGAVFIDSNCDLVLTAKTFLPLIQEKIDNKMFKVILKHPDHPDEFIGIANSIDDAETASCYALMKFRNK